MEWWQTVILVVATNIIIGAVSVCSVKKQIEHSHKQWIRELRSQPLLKLRDELVLLATNYERALAAFNMLFNPDIPGERSWKELGNASKNIATYGRSGDWKRALFMIYDPDIREKALEIIGDYQRFEDVLKSVRGTVTQKMEELRNAYDEVARISGENETRMEQFQLLIENKLSEL